MRYLSGRWSIACLFLPLRVRHNIFALAFCRRLSHLLPTALIFLSNAINGFFWTIPFFRWNEMYDRMNVQTTSHFCHGTNNWLGLYRCSLCLVLILPIVLRGTQLVLWDNCIANGYSVSNFNCLFWMLKIIRRAMELHSSMWSTFPCFEHKLATSSVQLKNFWSLTSMESLGL